MRLAYILSTIPVKFCLFPTKTQSLGRTYRFKTIRKASEARLQRFRKLVRFPTKMVHTTQQLLADVAQARHQYLTTITAFSEQQAQWQPTPNSWNAVAITEHLYWAEQGGILGMWKTLLGIRAGAISYEADRPHDGLPIDAIIQRTWREKEDVPAVAAPRLGGPLAYWASALHGLQANLTDFGNLLTDADLSRMAHLHPISGPLSFGQRLEFLRFHIDRDHAQRLLQVLEGQANSA